MNKVYLSSLVTRQEMLLVTRNVNDTTRLECYIEEGHNWQLLDAILLQDMTEEEFLDSCLSWYHRQAYGKAYSVQYFAHGVLGYTDSFAMLDVARYNAHAMLQSYTNVPGDHTTFYPYTEARLYWYGRLLESITQETES